MSTAPAPPSVPKVPADAAALDLASFAAYLHSGHAAQEARLEAELDEEAHYRRAADLPPETAHEAALSGPFVAHHASALPDPGAWLARVASDLRSPAGAVPGPGLGGAEQEALQWGVFAASQDEEIQQQQRLLDRQVRPAVWATPLVEGRTDGAPVFELTPAPARRPALQGLAARVADPAPGAVAAGGELPPPQAQSALAPLEIELAHQPALPWWLPRPPNIEVPGLPGLVAARGDGPWLAAVAPPTLGSVAATPTVTAVPDFVYQRFEWDEDFGFNPWNPAPQAASSGAAA